MLVIHGVSNHTPERFHAEVEALQQVLGTEWRAIKVFWGDLGAKVGVDYGPVIPSMAGSGVRAADDGATADADLASAILPATTGAVVRSADTRVELLVMAATRVGVRSSMETAVDAAIAAAIRDETVRTMYLSRIDNAAVLAAVGRFVGDATRRAADGAATDKRMPAGLTPGRAGPGTAAGRLGWSASSGQSPEPGGDAPETRKVIPDVGHVTGGLVHGAGRVVGGLARNAEQIARALLHDADQIVGTVLGQVLGNLNEAVRRGFVSDALGFIGDIFVYEHLRPLVQERIWKAIDGDPELGDGRWGRDPGRRVHLAGHSLGGVIAFHAATAADTDHKLYLDGLVTFGSQAPMFHLMDPVGSGIPAYEPGRLVPVGDGIQRWTNLWEPMDPLAFIAARVFQLGTPEHPVAPHDVAVAHLASYGLWTHSAYWHAPELPSAIAATMA